MRKLKVNYDKEMLKIIEGLEGRPRLLLHSCCGPCSSSVIEKLVDYFDITVFYYNPNIEPLEEYEHRKSEQIRLINSLNGVDFLDCEYENEEFKEISKDLEWASEGGVRCPKCFKLRMEKTALKALESGYDYFGTTLTVSPHKNSQVINEIGKFIEEEYNIKYLYADFKKRNGYLRSIELSKKYDLYRQNYCGCLFSKDVK